MRDGSKITAKQCTRCGKESHPRNQCPARDAINHKCGKKGHYSLQCRSKRLDESGLETVFLDAATSPAEETTWYVDVVVGEEKVTFKARYRSGGDSSFKGYIQAAKCPSTQHAPTHALWALEEALERLGPVLDGIFPTKKCQVTNRCLWLKV